MKKVLSVLVIAGTLVACNNAADSTENKKDSIDSAAGVTKQTIDSSAEAKKEFVDSSAEAKKEVVEKVDSLNKKDSANKSK